MKIVEYMRFFQTTSPDVCVSIRAKNMAVLAKQSNPRLYHLVSTLLCDHGYEFARSQKRWYLIIAGTGRPYASDGLSVMVPIGWLYSAKRSDAYAGVMAALLEGTLELYDTPVLTTRHDLHNS